MTHLLLMHGLVRCVFCRCILTLTNVAVTKDGRNYKEDYKGMPYCRRCEEQLNNTDRDEEMLKGGSNA